VATIEWLRLLPKPGFFPQIAQTLDTAGQCSQTPESGILRGVEGETIWIGLAHVEPMAAGDASNAYTNVVAPAEDEPEFTARARAALEEVGYRLVELEDAEPLSRRFKAADFDLIELGLEAARSGTPAFTAFYEYPPEGEGEDEDEDETATDPESIATALEGALGSEVLVRLAARDWDARHDGYVVALSDDWVLLHAIDANINLNGYTALPLTSIGSAQAISDAASFGPRSLRARGLLPVAEPRVRIDSLRDVLETVHPTYLLVTIHIEAIDPDVAYIGRVRQLSDEEFALEQVTPAGRWSDVEWYRYEDVTRVDFGGGYEEALARAID
jgi:hypothetical protein